MMESTPLPTPPFAYGEGTKPGKRSMSFSGKVFGLGRKGRGSSSWPNELPLRHKTSRPALPPTPDLSELRLMMETYMSTYQVDPETKMQILLWPPERKWAVIQAEKLREEIVRSESLCHDVDRYICAFTQSKPTLLSVLSLRRDLQQCQAPWVNEFVANGGLQALLGLLDQLQRALLHASLSHHVEEEEEQRPIVPPRRGMKVEQDAEVLHRSREKRLAMGDPEAKRRELFVKRILERMEDPAEKEHEGKKGKKRKEEKHFDVPLCLVAVEEIVACLKKIMFNKEGLDAVISFPDALRSLVTLLALDNVITMQRDILLILASMCAYSERCHRLVLDALDFFHVTFHKSGRFLVVVEILNSSQPVEVKAAVISLINALIVEAPSVEGRLGLRWEMTEAGVMDSIDKIAGETEEEGIIQTQISIFRDTLCGDAAVTDFADEFQYNPELAFVALQNQWLATERLSIVPQTLQKLLQLYSPGEVEKIWQLIEHLMTKMEGERAMGRTAGSVEIVDAEEYEQKQQRIVALKSEVTDLMKENQNVKLEQQRLIMEKQDVIAQLEVLRTRVAHAPATGTGEQFDHENVISETASAPSAASSAPPAPPAPPPPAGGPPPPPPPPPPGMKIESSLPSKPVLKPLVQMKQLYWTKIPVAKVEKTLWKDITEEDVTVEPRVLEELFGAGPSVEQAKGKVEARPMSKKGSAVISLLDFKRANNVAIMLSQLTAKQSTAEGSEHVMRLDASEICSAVYRLDSEILSVEHLKGLTSCAPSAQELETISTYEGDEKNLGKAERFFKETMSVPRYTQRLTCFLFMQSFESKYNELRRDVRKVFIACKELTHSVMFKQVLKIILAIGNYMNGGTFRGGAYGFKIDTLQKLNDTKAVDRKTTLLRYVVSFVDKTDPKLLSFPNQLHSLEEASRASPQAMEQELKALNKGIQMIHSELCSSEYDDKDPFRSVMPAFFQTASGSVELLSNEFTDLMAVLRKVAETFGEDASAFDAQEFFGAILHFVKAFREAKRTNDLERGKELEKQKRERERDQRVLRKKVMQTHSSESRQLLSDLAGTMQRVSERDVGAAQLPVGEEAGELIGNLMEAVRSGRTFRLHQKKKEASKTVEIGVSKYVGAIPVPARPRIQKASGPSTASLQPDRTKGMAASPTALYVGNISDNLDEDIIRDLLSSYGEMKDVVFLAAEGQTKSCAYVEFVNPSVADRACKGLNGLDFGGEVLETKRGIQVPPSSPQPEPPQHGNRVRATHTFQGSNQDELAFRKGAIIENVTFAEVEGDVEDFSGEGWWWGVLNGVRGLFPSNYVERI